MNKRLLESRMVEHGDNQAILAGALGISTSRLNNKINGRKGAQFWASEIRAIAERYGLKAKEIVDIFFAEKVS